MDEAISVVSVVSLLLEGAVLALSLELIIHCLASRKHNQSSKIRILKISMAIGLFVKSVMFSTFNISTDDVSCKIAGKVGNGFFHLASLSCTCILLLRVTSVLPDKYQPPALIFHTLAFTCRLLFSIFDIILDEISITVEGVCVLKENSHLVAMFAILDSVIDVYVTLTISIILTKHIRKINSTGVGGNINLYVSVVLTNVIRTATLSVVNIFTTIYVFLQLYNMINVYIIWPIISIVLIVTVGYDTNITNTIKRLREQARQDNDSHTTHNTLVSSNFSPSPSDRRPSNMLKRQQFTTRQRLSGFSFDRNGDLESGVSYYTQQSHDVHNDSRLGDGASLSCTILDMTERDLRYGFVDRSKSF